MDCYIGGQVGGVFGNGNYTNLNNTSTFGGAAIGSSFTQNNSGFIGGGQIGYNLQIENLVVGLEASLLGSSASSSSNQFNDDGFSSNLKGLLLLTGRIGYASSNWLFYGKGGYAGAQQTTSVSDTNPAFGVGSGSASNWHNGWTVGAGIEHRITKNWIAGLEYDYVSLSSKNYDLDGTDVPAA